MRSDGWEHPLDLRTMYTPLERCISIRPGMVDSVMLGKLKDEGYDQAPIIQDNGEVIGLIRTDALERLYVDNQELIESASIVERIVFSTPSTLNMLLDTMSMNRAAIVMVEGRMSGLLTISDLNKHSLRLVLYSILAELEIGLAGFIAEQCQDPWEWLRGLSKDHQAHILGWWEVAKQSGVDTGPLASCMLAHLISILGNTARLREDLGYRSKGQVQDRFGRLMDFRNKIMHPVRPLVLRQTDVAEIRETVGRAAELDSRIKEKTGIQTDGN